MVTLYILHDYINFSTQKVVQRQLRNKYLQTYILYNALSFPLTVQVTHHTMTFLSSLILGTFSHQPGFT